MIYKRCSRCGKRIESGKTCECRKQRHKEYYKYSRDKKANAFYDSHNWNRMRHFGRGGATYGYAKGLRLV